MTGCIFSSNLGADNSSSTPMSGDLSMADMGDDDLEATPDMNPVPDLIDLCNSFEPQSLCDGDVTRCGTLDYLNFCTNALETIECGECGDNEQCNDNNLCECAPTTDEEFCDLFDATCGVLTAIDPCTNQGRTVTCGDCPAGVPCQSDFTCSNCMPEDKGTLCNMIAGSCGPQEVTDSCGNLRTVTCGACAQNNERCVNGMCTCEPETDVELCVKSRLECGESTIMDRCGMSRKVNCGQCIDGDLCNDDNKCPTQRPRTDAELCAQENASCGMISASRTNISPVIQIDCGECQPGQMCDQNSCVCPTLTCAEDSCGVIRNACGDTKDCGTMCGSGKVCENNTCTCPDPVCQPDQCDVITNECGATADCGVCEDTFTCDTNNLCTCEPKSECEMCADVTCMPGLLETFCAQEVFSLDSGCGMVNVKCCEGRLTSCDATHDSSTCSL